MRIFTVNADLHEAIIKSGNFYWQVARRCGISAPTLSVWLREPLASDDPRRIKILAALEGAADHGAKQEETT